MKPWYRRFLSGHIRLAGGGGGGGGGEALVYFGDADNFTNLDATANAVSVAGFVLPYALKFSNLTIRVSAGDAANDSDAGVYNQAGNLIANIGAQKLGAGTQTIPTVQGLQTIPPGLYLFALTSAGSALIVACDFDAPTWFVQFNVAASVGGALPAAIGVITVTPSYTRLSFQLS